jgi:hypothetical protein
MKTDSIGPLTPIEIDFAALLLWGVVTSRLPYSR